MKGIFARIYRYFKNHPVVFSFVFAILLVIVLHFTYVILADLYPPEMIGNYIICIEWANGYGVTHRYMLIAIYGSLIFLFSSLAHLRVQVLKTLSALELSIEEPENLNTKLVFSRWSYLLALVLGFLFVFGFELFLLWAMGYSLEIVSINIPISTYLFSMYFLIAFLVGKGVWLILTSIYFINQAARQDFKMDVSDPWPWTYDENIGGFKRLSDLSSRIFEVVPVGILLFSPAVVLYYSRLYAAYFFVTILVGLFLFIRSQQIIHKGILKSKERFRDLSRNKLESGEISRLEYLDLLGLINSIKDRPVNLSVLWGIFISSIVLPVLYWYILMVLQEILQIVAP